LAHKFLVQVDAIVYNAGMNKIRFQIVGAFAAITLCSALLQQLFTTILFERNPGLWSSDLTLSLPLVGVVLVVATIRLIGFLKPVWGFLADPGSSGPESRLEVRRRLARVPGFLFVWNLALFFLVPLADVFLQPLVGHPVPGALDVFLILSLNLAFGALSTLQGQSWIEAITLPVRRQLQLTDVSGSHHEMNLGTRLFLVNLASVALSGLLASMAALGFYREVVAYYTKIAADAVTAASVVSADAVNDNELKVVFQLFVLFLAVLGWTVALTMTSLATVSKQLKALGERVGEMAQGSADLGRRAEVVFFDEVGLLTGRINAVMGRLQSVVSAIQTTSAQVLASTARVRNVSQDAETRLGAVVEARTQAEEALGGQGEALGSTLEVAQDLESSSVSVKLVAADQGVAVARGAEAMESLAASVAAVRDLTVQADTLAGSLRETSEQGGQSVEAVRRSIEAISAAAQAVAGTVATIKKTASQTNLLAMNAAIEAAHAGASGLGFAVVAAEVRTLAENSSQGAKTIANLMRDMETKISEGDRVAREAGEAFSRIYGFVVQTSEVMGTVARAMDAQKEGTETMLATTRTLREASLQIGAVTDKQSVHAENLNRSVQILVETGAAMAMAQEVQGRAMNELTELVRTVVREVADNSQAAESLEGTVSGFSVTGTGSASRQ